MDAKQIAAISSAITNWGSLGIEIAGGVKALVQLIRAKPTDAELDAIIAAVETDAATRATDRAGNG